MVTWQPHPTSPPQSTEASFLAAIAAGEYDALLSRWAERLARWVAEGNGSRRFYFRPFPEMNGNWAPYSVDGTTGTSSEFVAAWRHVYSYVMNNSPLTAADVQWVWNPIARDFGPTPAEAYFPGADVIDWVGIDGYNWGDVGAHGWRPPTDVFRPMVERCRALTDVPLCIPEFGSSSQIAGRFDPARKTGWLHSAFDLFADLNVQFACYFDIDKETDWAVFDTPTAPTVINERGTRVYPAYKVELTTARVGGQPTEHTEAVFRGMITP
ncbi:glycoside hydrolase family 26 protein [Halomarina litorea]|uniref:glycoside hydrolase family 26 protein n=1 Tax=Halomarina litorea TaxID=2961595 RepID=UPI0020C4EC97|nr:glycosyl hydrolase [Halomarina sp. BCD28]